MKPSQFEWPMLCTQCEQPFDGKTATIRHPVAPHTEGLPDRNTVEWKCPHCGHWQGSEAVCSKGE